MTTTEPSPRGAGGPEAGLHGAARAEGAALRANLDAAGVACQEVGGSSLCLREPDGARLEVIGDPLGEMHGRTVL